MVRTPCRKSGEKESSLGMKGCGKSCRGKWSSNESFTPQEEDHIIKLHAALGSRWSIIAHQLPGRTENEIKNHWNTKLRKKLTEKGIDPVTHRPFSQILADYGKIGGLSRSTGGSRYIGPIKPRVSKPKPEPEPEPSSLSYNFNSNTQEFPQLSIQNHTHSLDLLSQLQAITLVTEGTNPENNFSHFGYNNSREVDNKLPESFSWNDFLLDEAVKPAQQEQKEQEQDDYQMQEIGNAYQLQRGSSSSMSSFLEAMLDQENDMFLNFPGLMEEPLY